ncbi:MAG: pyruvate, phosphate dikinase [Spirochaetaceae bacterium]|jgi:pyruvate,orthophosphate dikinase|nr:pyruvate, phosphate dikinase [Spirochaetaceae bacterium]
MGNGIYFFSQTEGAPAKAAPELLGIRGRAALELAALGFPVLPGIIVDAAAACNLASRDIQRDLKKHLAACSHITGRTYGDPENPLLLKIVVSPNLAVSDYPVLGNLGLAKPVVAGFARQMGESAAAREVLFLVWGMLQVEERIAELEIRLKERKKITARRTELERLLSGEPLASSGQTCMEEYAGFLPEGFFESAGRQLEIALKAVSRLLDFDDQNDRDTALVIQPLVYGTGGKDSCFGEFFTRNVITGEKKLQGEFYREQNRPDFTDPGYRIAEREGLEGFSPSAKRWGRSEAEPRKARSGACAGRAQKKIDLQLNNTGAQDIQELEPRYVKELEHIGRTLEDTFREIRRIRFIVENKRLWLIEQGPAEQKSTRADIALLLDLAGRKVVEPSFAVTALEPLRLNEMLHPVIDPAGAKGLRKWSGGIAGAPGTAVGRAFFSAEGLLEARKLTGQLGSDMGSDPRAGPGFILVVPVSFAGDVTAIEAAAGVLTAGGGYSAHASVAARQYGKVSLVAPELKIRGKKAVLGDIGFSEGDYITLDVPYDGEASVYQGAAALTGRDPAGSGLFELIALARDFLGDFQVRANAETPEDALLARTFGAEGIGLCRTEHLFFKAGRINLLRDMILAGSPEERQKALDKLQVMQRQDFYGIFKVMAGKKVTIRLLDAPFHEFMPHTDEELSAYLEYAAKTKKNLSRGELQSRIQALAEFNPMLGRRGCRIAVSYPEIYTMQVRAVFEAAYALREEKITVYPEIMVPLIMNAAEFKLIAYGKKIEGADYEGIAGVENALGKEKKARPLAYKIGAMIEVPAAALGAADIAQYSGFFCFGTNDLTQTALGISRDDCAFMPDYTRYDLIPGDPFSALDPRVRELITLAVERGRLTRPDLICGLCGEHGAQPETVRFCVDAGLDYVSCSPYAVPVALLAAAQAQINKAKESGQPE